MLEKAKSSDVMKGCLMWGVPHKGKRLLMITPDVMIDRRILIEADTLATDGYEVYLLAGWDGSQANLFEVQGKVHVERIGYDGLDQRLYLIYKMHGQAVAFLNQVSSTINRVGEAIAVTGTALVNKTVGKIKGDPGKKEVVSKQEQNFQTQAGGHFGFPIKVLLAMGGKLIRHFLCKSIAISYRFTFHAFLVFSLKLSYLAIHLTAKLLNLFVKGMALGFPRVTGFNGYEYAFFKRALFYRPDIIHVHDLPMLRIGARLKKRLGIPLIYDMHEFYPEQETLSMLQRNRLRFIEKKYISHCDRLITVNPLLAQEISTSYGNVAINVIQNATVIPGNFHDIKYDLFREEYGISKLDIIILYQGWISEHRNIQNLVAGLSGVKEPIKLVIMGYGDYKYELASIANERGVTNKVVFVPSKSQEELLYYTASADLGIIPYPLKLDPNTKFSSPNKLYEFIAARLPILCNNLPFVRKVVVDNQFGLAFDMDSPESFTHALNSFPYDQLENFRENLALKGANYLWEAEAPKLLGIYRSLDAA